MTIGKDSKITAADMNALHTSTKQALTKTKRSFTWTKWPVTNVRNVDAVDFTEMRSALNSAYDYRTVGGSAGYSSNNTGDDRDYSYHGDDSTDYGDHSDHSSNYSGNQTDDSYVGAQYGDKGDYRSFCRFDVGAP